MAIVALAILTLVEFLVSAGDLAGAFVVLTVLAIAKAAIILAAFMHLRNIFGVEG